MKKYLLFSLTLFMCVQLFAQDWFEKSKLTTVGVYYYPEQWDSTQWERDIKKMAEMGFEFTHFAEFAWSFLEPEEGKFNFRWLDKALDLAGKYNLKVVMCTPSATPPAWLTKKYPEILVVKDDGITAMHGTREHYSWSSAKYRELTAKIVTEMAKRYGKDKRIIGWQIDNEPSHYGTEDYNPEARIRFIEWLKRKYGNLDLLNIAWGTAFWSGTYTSYDQIELPNPRRMISGVASPHSYMDFKRFNADECADFVSMQYTLLKKMIAEEQWVTTNFMHWHDKVDPWRNSDLDFICYTMYPVAGYTKGIEEQGFRMGDAWRIAFANDYYRPCKGVTGVMELQPGQVNWGQYNPQPYPGAIRAWLWDAFSGGLSFICSYRYRQPLYGSEQMHYGMISTDGITPSYGGEQYSAFIQEVNKLRAVYKPAAVIPAEYAAKKTAFLLAMDNVWNTNMANQKQTYQWSYEQHFFKYYSLVKSMCVPVDVIDEKKDFSAYKFLIAPAYQLLDEQLVNKWTKYVEQGGHLILTCRSGQKDRNAHLWQGPWAMPINNLIGAKIPMYDVLHADYKATVSMNAQNFVWNNWADILEPNAGTETWAVYNDQFYKGKAAVVHRKVGKGSVTYIGVDSDDELFEKQILTKVYILAGTKPMELPAGVRMEWRDGFWIAINYSSSDKAISIPNDKKIIVGTSTMAPAGVVVWQE